MGYTTTIQPTMSRVYILISLGSSLGAVEAISFFLVNAALKQAVSREVPARWHGCQSLGLLGTHGPGRTTGYSPSKDLICGGGGLVGGSCENGELGLRKKRSEAFWKVQIQFLDFPGRLESHGTTSLRAEQTNNA